MHSGPIDDDEKSPTRIKNKRRGRNKNTTPFDPEVQDMIEQTQQSRMYTNQSKIGESEQQPDDSLAEIIREQDAEEAELRKLIEEQRR